MCFALNHFEGTHFNRITAYCGDASKSAVWDAVNRVRDSLVSSAPLYIKMPSDDECEATAQRMFEKYHLPNFAYAVYGMLVRFDGAVRSLPVGHGRAVLQSFFTRNAAL
jgi:hypothetical protein